MKHVITAAFLFYSTLLFAHEEESWEKPITLDARASGPIREIPKTDYFEVAASIVQSAIASLSDRSARSIGQESVGYYGSLLFECKRPKYPFLVRATYQNGGTGTFSLTSYGTTLLVSHDSLGAPSKSYKTVIVVCLEAKPSDVFMQLSGAM